MDYSFFRIKTNNEKADKNKDGIIDAKEYQQVRGNVINHLEKSISEIVESVNPEAQKHLRHLAEQFNEEIQKISNDKILGIGSSEYRMTGEAYKEATKDYKYLSEVLTECQNLPNNKKPRGCTFSMYP